MSGAGGFLTTGSNNQTPMPYDVGIGMAVVFKQSKFSAYGRVTGLGSGAAADVWEGGGDYPYLAAASILEFLSASASDTSAGTGSRSFTILGLDANYNQISETVVMNGVTPVPTVKSYLRINAVTIASAGSVGVNVGDVTIRVVSAGATLSIVRAGYGYSKSCLLCVPAGFTYLVRTIFLSVLGAAVTNGATFGFKRRSSAGVISITNEYNITSVAAFQRSPVEGGAITEKTDVLIRVTNAQQAATTAFAAIEGVLAENTTL